MQNRTIMKLKKEFLTHEIDDSLVVISASTKKEDFHGLLKANESAKFIINRLNKEITFDQLLCAFLDEYEVNEEDAVKAINYVISQLKKVDALEE